MKLIKHIAEVFLLILTPLCCFAGTVTYKSGNHFPLIFIADQTISENPERDSYANVHTLDIALKANYAPILVSRNILYNFAYRKNQWDSPTQEVNRTYKDSPLSKSEWELYTLADPKYFTNSTMLYLLIPRGKKNSFTQLFNFKNFKELSILPQTKFDDYKTLVTILKPSSFLPKNPLNAMVDDLKKIFIPATVPSDLSTEQSLPIHEIKYWEAPILDVFLNGHGQERPEPLIANLSSSETQILLTFFNTIVRVGTLIISSCFAGGKNKRPLTFKQDINNKEIFYPLNYIIIIESVGDIITYSPSYSLSPFTGKSFFPSIFDIAAKLGEDPSHSLNGLLQELGNLYGEPIGVHNEANIPQIILPGGIEIQSLTPSNNVLVLGTVKVRVAELEKKTINIFPKKISPTSNINHLLNVLVYPPAIDSQINIRPSHLHPGPLLQQKIKAIWNDLPSFNDLVTKYTTFFSKFEIATLFSQKLNIFTVMNAYYLYPNILSMIHGEASHYIKKIVFEGDGIEASGGILMGLRDSFLDVSQRPTTKTFFIDSIEGANDISLILKSLRLIENSKQPHPLEKELPEDDEILRLRNVVIKTNGQLGLQVSIKFQIDSTAWEFQYNNSEKLLNKNWHFIPIDKPYLYEKNYQEAKNEILNQAQLPIETQPRLVDVLKEKIIRSKESNSLYSRHSLFQLSSTLEQLAKA